MKEENKIHPLQGEQNQTPDSSEGSRDAASGSFWRRLLAKKWVFPATYIAVAAIILALMWAYQDSTTSPVAEQEVGLDVTGEVSELEETDALPVTVETETPGWPVSDRESLEVTLEYFDVNDSNEDNQAAMVEYGDTYTPHLGVDLSNPNNEPFEVLAAMSGTVIRAEQVPVVGNIIEIQHENGLSTVYQSVTDIQVQQGDEIQQGDLIAQAGRSELEKDLGIHLHFEVWENGQPVNPENYLE